MSVYNDQKSKIIKGILKNILGIILWSFLAHWATDGTVWNFVCYFFNFFAIFGLVSNFRKLKKVMRTEKLQKENLFSDFGSRRTYRTKSNSSGGSQGVYNKYTKKYQTASEYKEYLDQILKDLYNNLGSESKQSSQYNYSYKAPVRRKNGFTVTEAFKLFSLDKNSDEITIKKKYRVLAKKWHPDCWSTDTEENKKIAERNFIKVSNANEVIKQFKGIK